MAGSMLIMIPKTADFIRRRADNSSISGTTGLMKVRAKMTPAGSMEPCHGSVMQKTPASVQRPACPQ